MDKEIKSELRELIMEYREENWNELIYMVEDLIQQLFSNFRWSKEDRFLRQKAGQLILEYWQIITIEKRLFRDIWHKRKDLYLEAIYNIFDELYEIHDARNAYYDSVIDSFATAVFYQDLRRFVLPKKDYKDVCDEETLNQLYAQTLSERDVIKFLHIPKDFINYLLACEDTRIYYLNKDDEEHQFFFGVLHKCDELGNLEKIKLFIPRIIDMESAELNVLNFAIAYELYKRLSTPIKDEDIHLIEEKAQSLTRQFKEQKSYSNK